LIRIGPAGWAYKDWWGIVVTNNHSIGKGIVNAFENSSILKDEPLPMPPELVERYPELRPLEKKERRSGLLIE